MCACVWHRLPIPGTNQRSAPAACSICSKAIGPEGAAQKLRFPRWSRPHSFGHSEHQPKGVRRQQKGRKEAERASPHLFAHKRSAPAAERKKRGRTGSVTELQRGKLCPAGYLSTLGLGSGPVGVVAAHPLSMREGPGSIPGLSMPMCACVGLSRLGFAVRLAKGGCCAAAGCRTSLLNPKYRNSIS